MNRILELFKEHNIELPEDIKNSLQEFNFDESESKQDETDEELEEAASTPIGKMKAENAGDFDSIGKNKDGNYIARRQFFYKQGKTAEDYEERLKNLAKKAGVEVEIVDSGEVYKPFRGGASTANSSHFFVVFNIKDSETPIEEEDSFEKKCAYCGKEITGPAETDEDGKIDCGCDKSEVKEDTVDDEDQLEESEEELDEAKVNPKIQEFVNDYCRSGIGFEWISGREKGMWFYPDRSQSEWNNSDPHIRGAYEGTPDFGDINDDIHQLNALLSDIVDGKVKVFKLEGTKDITARVIEDAEDILMPEDDEDNEDDVEDLDEVKPVDPKDLIRSIYDTPTSKKNNSEFGACPGCHEPNVHLDIETGFCADCLSQIKKDQNIQESVVSYYANLLDKKSEI